MIYYICQKDLEIVQRKSQGVNQCGVGFSFPIGSYSEKQASHISSHPQDILHSILLLFFYDQRSFDEWHRNKYMRNLWDVLHASYHRGRMQCITTSRNFISSLILVSSSTFSWLATDFVFVWSSGLIMESDSDTDSVLSCSPTMRRRNFGYIGAFKVCFWNILLHAKFDVMFMLISFLLIYASAALWCEHQAIQLCLSRRGEGPKPHMICCASLANPFILFL